MRPYRRAAKVPYPNAYASAVECRENKDKYLFNCAQRAHGNFLEHQPSMLVGLLVGGLKCMCGVCLSVCLFVGVSVKTMGWGEGRRQRKNEMELNEGGDGWEMDRCG